MYGTILTFVVAYGGAVFALFYPFVGFLCYVALGLIAPEDMFGHALPTGNYSRVVGVAMLLGWALNGFGSWQLGKAWAIVLSLIGFWLWNMLSAANAISNPDRSWDTVFQHSKTVLPFLVGITTLDSTKRLRILAWVIVLSQGLVAYELNKVYLGGFNRVHEYGYRGMDNNSVAISMNACVGVALFLAVSAERWWQKIASLGCLLLIVHTVLLSFSRGGMLGLIVTCGVTFILLPKQPRHYLFFFAVIAIGFRLAGPQVVERFSTTFADEANRDYSAQSRLDLWRACIECMNDYPLAGIGPSQWPRVAPRYGFVDGKSAHTTWLETGAEVGYVGFVFFVAFYALTLGRLSRLLWRKDATALEKDLSRLVIASIVGFAVSAQFVSLVGLEVPYYVVLIGAGVLRFHNAAPSTVGVPGIPRMLPQFQRPNALRAARL